MNYIDQISILNPVKIKIDVELGVSLLFLVGRWVVKKKTKLNLHSTFVEIEVEVECRKTSW